MTTTYCKRVAVGCMLALAAFLYCALPALAQQTLGSINGTVLDPSGASVADATITITDAQIDVTRTAKSGSNGFFQVFNLPIGTYKVSVSREGFEITNQEGVLVNGNAFGSNLKVQGNAGGTTVANNTVAAGLTVTGNTGAVVDTPNEVEGKSKLQ